MNPKLNVIFFRVLFFVAASSCTWTATLSAHTGMHHDKHSPHSHDEPQAKGAVIDQEKEKLASIDNRYQSLAKRALIKACGDCHSKYTMMPWYSSIPGIKEMIEDDISEAKTHLDISNDFPFQGHGSPQKDLEAIEETLSSESMPPLKYSLMHPNNKLSENEKIAILKWVDESLKELRP